jgi:hypothetical protein
MADERYFYWDRSNRLTMTDIGPGAGGTLTQYGYDPSGRLIDRIGADGTKEKRYYAAGLSPVLVKRWDGGPDGEARSFRQARPDSLFFERRARIFAGCPTAGFFQVGAGCGRATDVFEG